MGMVERLCDRKECCGKGAGMIRIEQIKMKTSHTKAELKKKVGHILGVSGEEITGMEIIKRSIDARKKPEIYYVYTVDVALSKTKSCLLYTSYRSCGGSKRSGSVSCDRKAGQ